MKKHALIILPVKFVGVGEGIEDLQKFDVDEYVKALFYKEGYTEDADEE